MKKYDVYTTITKELLDEIKVGDLVKVNDRDKPMKVVGVSDNYFCMIQKVFGEIYYSVCEKKPWGGIRHNAMRGGMFHCGADNTIFGAYDFDYKFDDENKIRNYLKMFEEGLIELSCRTSIPIRKIQIKKYLGILKWQYVSRSGRSFSL